MEGNLTGWRWSDVMFNTSVLYYVKLNFGNRKNILQYCLLIVCSLQAQLHYVCHYAVSIMFSAWKKITLRDLPHRLLLINFWICLISVDSGGFSFLAVTICVDDSNDGIQWKISEISHSYSSLDRLAFAQWIGSKLQSHNITQADFHLCSSDTSTSQTVWAALWEQVLWMKRFTLQVYIKIINIIYASQLSSPALRNHVSLFWQECIWILHFQLIAAL